MSAQLFDDYADLRTRRCCRLVSFGELAGIIARDVEVSAGRIEEVLTRTGKSAEDLAEAVDELRRRRSAQRTIEDQPCNS